MRKHAEIFRCVYRRCIGHLEECWKVFNEFKWTLVLMYLSSLLTYQMNHQICKWLYGKGHCDGHLMIILCTIIPSAIILFRHYIWEYFAYSANRMQRVILSKCFGIDYFPEVIAKAQIFLKNGHQCSICHCGFTDKAKLKILKCGHSFHEHCIYQWEQTQSMHVSYKCPLCRGEYLKCDKVDYEFREQEEKIDFQVPV